MELDDLIDQLCVMAGMIMEDASVGAISTRGDIRQRVAGLDQATREIRVLADAAAVLIGRLH